MTPCQTPEHSRPPRARIVAVQFEFNSSLAELDELAKTLGLEVVGQITQKRAAFNSTVYMGVGKREETLQAKTD